MTIYTLFVGIDIAATSFTTSRTTQRNAAERAQTFVQTPDWFAACLQWLHASGREPTATLVVIEATGSYWVALAVQLHQAGYMVSVVNPAHVHTYAETQPRRAKTDAQDAQLLAEFALERQPAPRSPPPQVYHELRQRLVARDGLLHMLQRARNQVHALQQWPVLIAAVQTHLARVITELDVRINALER